MIPRREENREPRVINTRKLGSCGSSPFSLALITELGLARGAGRSIGGEEGGGAGGRAGEE